MSSLPGSDRDISLIIPCYNGGQFIGEALDSALEQSLAANEIIVVDDGSTDNSSEVVRRYGDRVRYIAQANSGEPSARNTGIGAACCSLIAFLDADDLWTADSLAERHEVLASDPDVDFVFGGTEQFVSAGCQRSLPPQPVLTAALSGATLFRKAAFDRIGLFDTAMPFGAMMDWTSRAKQAGLKGAALDRIVLKRRIHDRNSVHDAVGLRAGYLRVLRAAAERSRQNGG